MQHGDNKALHKFPSSSQFYEVHIIYVRELRDRPRELSEINHPRARVHVRPKPNKFRYDRRYRETPGEKPRHITTLVE